MEIQAFILHEQGRDRNLRQKETKPATKVTSFVRTAFGERPHQAMRSSLEEAPAGIKAQSGGGIPETL
jgi:hypothetical protein